MRRNGEHVKGIFLARGIGTRLWRAPIEAVVARNRVFRSELQPRYKADSTFARLYV